MAVLTGNVDELAAVPPETGTVEEVRQHELFSGCLALFSITDEVRSVEYYFRRYRFTGLPVTRSDHLRSCCEMYFDRLVQFRDRMKTTLSAARRVNPDYDFKIGRIIKAYDRIFDWEIRQRNRVHHKERYDDQYIDQLGLIQILEVGMPVIKEVFSSRGIHRKAVNLWVRKVRDGAEALNRFLEELSGLILAGLPPEVAPEDTGANSL